MGLTADRIAVVTGASRGAGRGAAVGLGSTGATVYVTGRTSDDADDVVGTVHTTAAAVTEAGGTGVAVVCDHTDDAQVAALFEQVRADHGRLDILVNNATSLPDGLTDKAPFWEQSLDMIQILDVGFRSHYVASYYAAPLLVANGAGLVVNTSSPGGRCYMHGPAYGAGKAGIDKMAHDMAHDFASHDVAVVSLWMGLLLTENLQAAAAADPEAMAGMVEVAETPEFTGLIIDAIANDPDYMAKSGQVFYSSELGVEYGVADTNGKQPVSHRDWLGPPTTFSDSVVE
jgi:NAD(P)-dependent dehydrogenase (short-subunit alcohol dehydrogenase family)